YSRRGFFVHERRFAMAAMGDYVSSGAQREGLSAMGISGPAAGSGDSGGAFLVTALLLARDQLIRRDHPVVARRAEVDTADHALIPILVDQLDVVRGAGAVVELERAAGLD